MNCHDKTPLLLTDDTEYATRNMQIKIGNKTATATGSTAQYLDLNRQMTNIFGTLTVKAAGLLCDGVTKCLGRHSKGR